MLPWTHMHVIPDGNVLPCCGVDLQKPVGSLKKQSLAEIWNNQGMRSIRKNMLSGRKSEACERCYMAESSGSHTLRKKSNADFSHHFDWVELTTEDGSLPYFKMPYFDVRFSNICNFRCRTCCPSLSSGTFADHNKIFGAANHPKVLRPTNDPQDLWEQLEPLLPHIEEIYFAGGEPLLMEEHYKILDYFLANDKRNIRIRYNTNFSTFTFRNWNVLDYWKKFERVEIGASLDAMGVRGELIRKGQSWEKTEAMRQQLSEECPHVKFYLAVTVSALNAFGLTKFHRTWADRKWIEPSGFVMSYLFTPEFMTLQVLDMEQKKYFRDEIENYSEEVFAKYGDQSERLRKKFQDVVDFTFAADHSELLPKLKDIMQKYDELRDENSNIVLPYLSPNRLNLSTTQKRLEVSVL